MHLKTYAQIVFPSFTMPSLVLRWTHLTFCVTFFLLILLAPHDSHSHCSFKPTENYTMLSEDVVKLKICYYPTLCALDTFYRDTLLNQMVQRFNSHQYAFIGSIDSAFTRVYPVIDSATGIKINELQEEDVTFTILKPLKGSFSKTTITTTDNWFYFGDSLQSYRALIDTAFIVFTNDLHDLDSMDLGPRDGCFYEPTGYFIHGDSIIAKGLVRQGNLSIGLKDFFDAIKLNVPQVPQPQRFNPPQKPSPPDSSHNIPVSTSLQFFSKKPDSNNNITYNIYFDTLNPPQKLYHSKGKSLSLSAPSLKFNTTYYWSIIGTEKEKTVKSAIWTFTTEPPLSPALIYPLNKYPNTSTTSSLKWSGRSSRLLHPVFYNVYLDTISPPIHQIASKILGTNYSPILKQKKIYYWKVTALQDSLSASSPIYSFKTRPQRHKIRLLFKGRSVLFQPENLDLLLEIFNIYGKRFLKKQIKSLSPFEFKLDKLPSGIYFLKIKSNKWEELHRLILTSTSIYSESP